MAFGPSGKTLAVGGSDTDLTQRATYVWDVATKTITATLADPGINGLDSVAFGPGKKFLAIGDGNCNTHLWNIASRTS